MAEAWTTRQLRAVIAETKLWEFSLHLRRLLEQDAELIENADSLEQIRQAFDNVLTALKAIAAQRKRQSLTVEASAHFQEHFRFSFWLLEQARSLLDKNGIETTKIPHR